MKALALCFGLILPCAATAAPACLDGNGSDVPLDDSAVAKWEHSTRPQFHARGHVSGQITELLPSKSGHTHFNVDVGGGAYVEVIYETAFGDLPRLAVGMDVEACGDYITVKPGEPGETGDAPGILHWVHRSNDNSHPDGFVAVDGRVFGD